jgi:hypothetical protein
LTTKAAGLINLPLLAYLRRSPWSNWREVEKLFGTSEPEGRLYLLLEHTNEGGTDA